MRPTPTPPPHVHLENETLPALLVRLRPVGWIQALLEEIKFPVSKPPARTLRPRNECGKNACSALKPTSTASKSIRSTRTVATFESCRSMATDFPLNYDASVPFGSCKHYYHFLWGYLLPAVHEMITIEFQCRSVRFQKTLPASLMWTVDGPNNARSFLTVPV